MDDEKLIECVRKYPCIYDMSDSKYMNTNYKSSIWKIISEDILLSDDNCKKRWANIRDQFKRSLNKRKSKRGQSTKPIKKYKYEDNLQFLMPHIQDRDIISNIENEDEQDDANDEVETDAGTEINNTNVSQSVQPPASPMQPQPSTSQSFIQSQSQRVALTSKLRSRDQRQSSRTYPETTTQYPQSASHTLMKYIIERNKNLATELDPIAAFFQGLIPTIKRFSPYYQHLAKGRIFSVVQELEYAQLQEANRTSDGTFSRAYYSTSNSSASTPARPSSP
ncbi:hypothetical protein HHI36_008565 [Cryptolaemus montrouzieri]|uniref:MADF domain-containing protein n=1 Tax=Cryptolaemus montrouzieri TaxID=559131 RepID=A0ABD2MST3_9CUCU